MHRAEKASSKICREREVEKAQELHRRKIDGVKSYLSATTRPPPPTAPSAKKANQSSTFYRRSLRQHASPASPESSSGSHVNFEEASCTSDGEYEHDEQYDEDSGGHEDDDNHEVSTSKSFGKLDELRSVLVPVMAYKDNQALGNDLKYERLLDEITSTTKTVQVDESHEHQQRSPRHPRHPSAQFLGAKAFRMRRLKQIESDNVTLFDRIKNSSAHYRADAFKRDWDQNVAYLTSICEFPVLEETVHPHPPRRQGHGRKQTPIAAQLPDQLPSLQHTPPPLNHPIRANPSSPRKPRQLNLSPAFRSLRKGLPQAPSLPPLTASPRASAPTMTKSVAAIAASRSIIFGAASQPMSPRKSPPKAEPSGQHAVNYEDESRYTLLKVGRFVGGKYLVLTVFCGDGITNPYGFDVVALDPETQVEFHLSITKETTHLLIDTISSSSMAQRTAAAAGTNLSMELIARCICEHVRYAFLGSCEVVFLVATVGNRGGLSGDGHDGDDDILHTDTQAATGDNCHLLLGTPFSAMAFCVHQCARLPLGDQADAGYRTLHVFASTRPPQCCRATMGADANEEPMRCDESSGYAGLVCYQVECGDDLPSHHVFRPSGNSVSLHLRVHELISQCETASIAMVPDAGVRLSLDRLMVLSLSYLHVGLGAHDLPRLEFDPAKKNNWAIAIPTHRSPTSLQRRDESNGRRQASPGQHSPRRTTHAPLHEGESSVLMSEDRMKTVVQTGVLWRGAFLLAQVALLCPCRVDEETRQVEYDPMDEQLIIIIFNSSTKKYSERTMDGQQVEAFSQKLGAWQVEANSEGVPPLVSFVKRLLVRLRLDVDLRGHEVVSFPSLEPRRQPSNRRLSKADLTTPLRHGCRESCVQSTKVLGLQAELDQHNHAITLLQALIRGYLWRRRLGRRTQPPAMERPVPLAAAPSFVDSLPPNQQLFVRNRAAKQIQSACREYADRTAKRKNADFDADGRIILTPRALTPPMRHAYRLGADTAHGNGVSYPHDCPEVGVDDSLVPDVLVTVVEADVEDEVTSRSASLEIARSQCDDARRQGVKSLGRFVLRKIATDGVTTDRTIGELGGLT